MAKINLSELTIKKTNTHLMAGDFSVEELCDACLEVIEKKNPEINAYLEVFDDVKEQAKRAQKKLDEDRKKGSAKRQAKEQTNFLVGIPIAVKDNMLIEGKLVSAASKILAGYRAPYSATAIKKLEDAGAIFLGRTNMDEFAMGASTENSAFGVTKNPHDTSRVSGGSSGGSAAVIAMDGALVALGSDTAGSVRQPASFCGAVGLKTTYGSVSRYGLIAMGSSLDQIGPITKTVEDAEIIFKHIKGYDRYDSNSIPDEKYTAVGAKGDEKNLVIGVPHALIEVEGIDPDVLSDFEASVKRLKNLGYKIEEIELPNAKYSLPAYYILMPGEVSSNLARFDGMKFGLHVSGDKLLEDYVRSRGEGFGPEPRRRILIGTYVLSAGYYDAYYNKAQAVRNLITHDFKHAFEKVDAIIMPTTPTPAFKIGEKSADPLAMYLADVFTVPSNIAGIPTITVPSGTTERDGKKLPLGLQILTPHCREDLLFKIGKEFLREE